MRFKINWRGWQEGYRVSVPDYNGGEVVSLDEVQQIEAQRDQALAALREIKNRCGHCYGRGIVKLPEPIGDCLCTNPDCVTARAALGQQAEGASE